MNYVNISYQHVDRMNANRIPKKDVKISIKWGEGEDREDF
jgi:hypothetical protein